MAAVAGVRLVGDSEHLMYADDSGLNVTVGELVVVALASGEAVGRVLVAPSQVVESQIADPLPPIVRRAAPNEAPSLRPAGAGAALLRSLNLPESVARPTDSSRGRWTRAPGPSTGEEGDDDQDQR